MKHVIFLFYFSEEENRNWNAKPDQHLSRQKGTNDIPNYGYEFRHMVMWLVCGYSYQSNGHYEDGENNSYESMAHFMLVLSPQLPYRIHLCTDISINMLKKRKCYNESNWKSESN